MIEYMSKIIYNKFYKFKLMVYFDKYILVTIKAKLNLSVSVWLGQK